MKNRNFELRNTASNIIADDARRNTWIHLVCLTDVYVQSTKPNRQIDDCTANNLEKNCFNRYISASLKLQIICLSSNSF